MAKKFGTDTTGELNKGLIAYYGLDSTTNKLNNVAGWLRGSAGYAAAKKGNGLNTNVSTSDYLEIPVLKIGGVWSVSFWFNYPLATTGSSWWTGLRAAEFGHHVIIDRATSSLGMYGSAGHKTIGFSMTSLSAGLHHMAVLGYGGRQYYYIDNVYRGVALDQLTSDIQAIGNYQGGTQNFGLMDELGVWNKILSTQEIADLYNNGNGSFLEDIPILQSARSILGGRLSFVQEYIQPSTQSFSPTNIPGCKLWIDVSQMTPIADGTSISSSTDLSDSGNNLSQISAGQNPKYYANSINGLPTMRGLASASSTFHIPWTYAAPNTFFYVAKQGTSKARVLSGRNNNWLMGFWGGYKNQAYFEGWVGANSDAASDTNVHVWSAVVASTSYLWDKGSLVKSGTGGVTAPANLCIGYTATSEFSDFDIGEIIGFNRQLSTEERVQVENYLRAKWGTG